MFSKISEMFFPNSKDNINFVTKQQIEDKYTESQTIKIKNDIAFTWMVEKKGIGLLSYDDLRQ
jgi:hypothetical protein